jgi:hypothetical protein
MLTINESANKDIEKAKRMLNRAVETLIKTIAYNNRGDIFHASTVHDVNRIITAIQTLND